MADPERSTGRSAPRFIVRTPHLPGELRDLLPGARGVPVYECRTPLREQVREAIRESPLVLGYELAVLKRVPAGRQRRRAARPHRPSAVPAGR